MAAKLIGLTEIKNLLGVGRGSAFALTQQDGFPPCVRLSALCGRGSNARSKMLWDRQAVLRFFEERGIAVEETEDPGND